MLKTLRITSLAAVILAACGVIIIVVLGFRGDPGAKNIWQAAGVTEQYKGKPTKGDTKLGEVHPLVAQAKLIALRLNPPPPPPPPPAPNQPKPDSAISRKPPEPPKPVVPQAKFELLATVRCDTDPKRSLALLKSGTTIEWFRQGEKAGHLTIDEIRDGSAVFSQDGRSQQTLSVPAKPEGKSLLKNAKTALASAAPPTPRTPTGVIASPADFRAQAAAQTQNQPAPRIQRVRAEVPQPSVDEQAASIDSTIAGIQEIMNSQDTSLSAEERKAEQETWNELLKVLQSEKENLKMAASAAAAEETPAAPETPAAADSEPSAAAPTEKAATPAPAVAAAAEEAANQPPAPVEDEGEGQIAPAAAEADPPTVEAEAPVGGEADPAQTPEAEAPVETPPNEY